ncbi:TrpR-like protein YerC/YecD [bacterium]|nr:TrpR-like protein YerC/YecD [bacterium]
MAKIKRKNRWINPDSDDLFRAILQLKDIKEARRFFRDLLTVKEILEFSKRWKTARMLNKKIPYTKIEKETGLSSTTIARVQKWLKRGMGGYRLILRRLKEK